MQDKIEVTVDNKDNTLEIIKLIGSFLIPISIAFSTYWYTTEQQENDRSLKYIEVAIGILKQPDSKYNKNLKIYAKDIMKKYSPIAFNEAVEKEIKNLDYFSEGYDVEVQEKVNDKWIPINGICVIHLRDVRPIPSKTIRWNITAPFNKIIDEKEYKIFIQKNNYKNKSDFLNELFNQK